MLSQMIEKSCYFCKKPITRLTGRDPDSLVNHHIDGNHENNAPENQTDAHFGCHLSHHQYKWTEEQRRNIRIKMIGNKRCLGRHIKWTKEQRELAALSHLGKRDKPMSDEGRKNIARAHIGLLKGKHWKVVNGKRVWFDGEAPRLISECVRDSLSRWN